MQSNILQNSAVPRDVGNSSVDNQESPRKETETVVWKGEILNMSVRELENEESRIVWDVLRPAGVILPGTDEHRATIDRLYEVRAKLTARKIEVQIQSNCLSISPVSPPVTPCIRFSASTPGVALVSLGETPTQGSGSVLSVPPPTPSC